ncbi:hypothetical protein [Aeoliella sp. SH292]|uniref:hypothetical protein n=1 Tax=Aeoliella sp. SH292 TaxID=3454464 RepID=UPI003F9BA804
MDKLLLQVRRAHRRLIVEQFLHYLVWSAFVALAIAAVAIAVPQLVAIDNLPADWATWWLSGAGVFSVLGAAGMTYLKRRTRLDAAMEIDRRYDLRERVASSLALRASDLETPAGQALLHDAARRVDRLDINEKFRPSVDRRAWLPLVPGALVFCLVMFGTNREAVSSVAPTLTAEAAAKVKKANEELQKKLAEMQKKAGDKDLKNAEETLKQLEEKAKELEAGETDPKKSLVKLNNLAKQLEDRRAKLGTSEALKKQMEDMKQLNPGPAEKLAKAMKEGDWNKALDEIKALQEKIAKGDMNQQDKQNLQKQLEQMKEKVAKANEANKEAMENLKKQVEEQKQKGDLAKAGELQQQLDKMQQQNQQPMENMEKLAEQLQQCENCMKQGDQQGAAKAMEDMAKQLEQMQKDGEEMQMLDEAMAQLDAAKQALCEQCNGQGQQMNRDMAGKGGKEWGTGRGGPNRSTDKIDAEYRDSRVRTTPGAGEAAFGGFVEGMNTPGKTEVAVEDDVKTINSEPADPLTSERLPRAHGEHAEEYFKQLRDN